jgi:hypothetical protein
LNWHSDYRILAAVRERKGRGEIVHLYPWLDREMVNKDVRRELATNLHRLVSGEMTNDEFDNQYLDRWVDDDDAAVAEIGQFGWGLYSDYGSYRLQGSNAVSEESKQVADRAILFLQTDLEYLWPRNVAGIAPFWGLWGPGFYLLFGVVFLLFASFAVGFNAVCWGLLGLLATGPTIHWLVTYRTRTEAVKRFHASGDFSTWPFLRDADYEAAKATAVAAEFQRLS